MFTLEISALRGGRSTALTVEDAILREGVGCVRIQRSREARAVWSFPPMARVRSFGDDMARMSVALVLCMALTVASCTSSTGSRPQLSPSVSPTTAAPETRTMCFAAAPPEWTAAMSKTVATLPAVNFGAVAVDDVHDVAYGFFQSTDQRGVAAVDMRTGNLSVVSTMTAQEAGVAWMSYADPWLVWAQGEAVDNLGNWSIQAWNRQTGERLQLATSQLPDGTDLRGELVYPVVGDGYAAWNQPTSASSADLRIYRFSSHQSTTLDSGRLSSPVLASRSLVWAKFTGSAAQPSFRFADAETLRVTATPAELTGTRPIQYLAGSSRYLVWTEGTSGQATDPGTLWAYDLSARHLTRYVTDSHYLQFPMLAGPILAWFAATVSAILDLRTGDGFDVPLPGSIGAEGDAIVVSRMAPGTKGAVTSTTVSLLRPSVLPSVQSCSG